MPHVLTHEGVRSIVVRIRGPVGQSMPHMTAGRPEEPWQEASPAEPALGVTLSIAYPHR